MLPDEVDRTSSGSAYGPLICQSVLSQQVVNRVVTN